MRRWPPHETIRGTLLVLIAVVMLPAAAAGAYAVFDEYRDRREAEVAANAELARAVASAFEAFVLGLARAEHAMAVSFATHGHTHAQIEAELVALLDEFPAVTDMSWADASGTVRASTEPALVGKSFYAREYFQEIVRGAAWRVSPLVRSLSDGRPVFVVARGYWDAGELVGVVSAAVDPERLDDVVGRRSGEGATSILDSTGRLVARFPRAPLSWDQRDRTAAHAGVRRALGGEEALGVFPGPWDDERRVGAVVPVRALGWAAHASRPLAEALAPARRSLAVSAASALAVVLAALFAVLYLARRITEPLRALEEHAAQLAREGPVAERIRGPGEVRRVARALDSMAASLAARREELERARRAEEELREERETLMATVSHDLRTPLHVIVGHAELLRRRGDEEAARRAGAILASAGRMKRLVDDLVDAARLEAGHLELRREPVELCSFLATWRERTGGALPLERLRIAAPESVPVVLADPARLDQILANLVSNAVKYSLPESEILLALTAAAEGLQLSVRDRGAGIPPEELPRLFERYYRAPTATRAEGLGLGLFITRKLVDAHGWAIQVESELGKGTVFTLVIPHDGGRGGATAAA
jgi:signal transduction histidine kinase